jgi:hypothetical protein
MSMFADYEEEVKECVEKCKGANAATASSNIAEAKDLIQQVRCLCTVCVSCLSSNILCHPRILLNDLDET